MADLRSDFIVFDLRQYHLNKYYGQRYNKAHETNLTKSMVLLKILCFKLDLHHIYILMVSGSNYVEVPYHTNVQNG